MASLVLEKAVLIDATEVFNSLGLAVLNRKMYGESHPRYDDGLEAFRRRMGEFFVEHPETTVVVYVVAADGIEFRRVPLVDMSAQGARLHATLQELSIGMLQIENGIADAEVRELVKRVSPGASPDGADGRVEGDRFRLFSRDEALKVLSQDDADGVRDALELPVLEMSEAAVGAVVQTYHSLLMNAKQGVAFDYTTLAETTEKLARLFAGQRGGSCPGYKTSYFDEFTFHHSINVGLLTAKLASTIVKDSELLGRITSAALLHDLGKTLVPKEVLAKPGRLTPGELDEMRKHPVLGAEMLLATRGVDPLSVNVAFGHHHHAGRSSYPKTLNPYRSDWVTQLISVVDIYEALTAVRPYKKALSTEKAFQVMVSMEGMRDRMPLVKLLFDTVGPYPVGAIVELNTGERAVVLEQDTSALQRPRIRILTDRNQNPYPIPREVSLAEPRASGAENELFIKHTVLVQAAGEDPLKREATSDSTASLKELLNDDTDFQAREG